MFQFPSVKVKRRIKNYTLSATYSRKNPKILWYYLLFCKHINKRHLLNSILPTMLVEGLSSNGILPLNETWNQKLVKGSISSRSDRCNMPLTSDCTELQTDLNCTLHQLILNVILPSLSRNFKYKIFVLFLWKILGENF